MTTWLHWLLGLEAVRLDGGHPVTLAWQLPWAKWVLFLGVVFALALVAATYERQPGSRWLRAALGCLRGLGVALVVILLCQPQLVLERTQLEPSVTALVVDSSASMARQDLYLDEGERAAVESIVGSARVGNASRLELAREALFRGGRPVPGDLFAAQRVVGYRADIDAFKLVSVDPGADPNDFVAAFSTLEATGETTNLPAALLTVLEDLRGKQLSAVVLVSDGRCTVPADFRSVTEWANRHGIRIHTVAVGSTTALADTALVAVEAEERVFVHDLVAIKARLLADGLDTPTPVVVQLLEEGREGPLASQTVLLGGQTPSTTVELRIRPRRTGRKVYRVYVPPLPTETELSNNEVSLTIEAVEDRLRVLYVDGYPRYEYRYLKNTLVREPTVVSSCLLLSADPQFVQEGQEPIRRFPETPEELFRYDVVLFGDVDPRGEWLSEGQMKMLLEFVAHRGGGVGFVAGEFFCPGRFAGTPLEVLLPVRVDTAGAAGVDSDLSAGFLPRLTPAGKLSSIFRLESDPDRNQETFERLPPLLWFARTVGPKPGAEVLLEHPTQAGLSGPAPLVAIGRYGAGRTFFQATDDTWRWRQETGEGFFDAYWLHVVRYLAGNRLTGDDRRFRLSTDKAVYDYGQPVRVMLAVLDAEVAAQMPARVEAVVRDAAGVPRARLWLVRESVGQTDAAGPIRYEGHCDPQGQGQFVVTALPPLPAPGQREPAVGFRVIRQSLESRYPMPDPEVLRQLSAQTGGRTFRLGEVGSLGAFVADRSLEIPDDVVEPIWDSKLAIALFVLIIGTEWVLRKLAGLV